MPYLAKDEYYDLVENAYTAAAGGRVVYGHWLNGKFIAEGILGEAASADLSALPDAHS